MDKNTELLQKILDKLDAIDSSAVGIQGDVESIAEAQNPSPELDVSKREHIPATLDDLYSQNNAIIGHLERLNENLYFLREAVYGKTAGESGENYDNPKHGNFGVVAEQMGQIESYLNDIATALNHRK